MMDEQTLRKIIREEINGIVFEVLKPYREKINRLVLDIYGENPDGSRADGGGLLELTRRNNVLLWVIIGGMGLELCFMLGLLIVYIVHISQ